MLTGPVYMSMILNYLKRSATSVCLIYFKAIVTIAAIG
jgi:hypothetical protein